VIVTIAGSYVLDTVQQAGEADACLSIAITFGFPRINVYDGEFCHGVRT